MIDPLLADLTPEQIEAVTHPEGPLLILAGAGSGKTRVITRRVAWLLRQGVKPWSILAITFTNKAAGEMRNRITSLVPGCRVTVCTFHSFGARLLRQYGERIGLARDFSIYDTDDRNKLIKEAIAAAEIDAARFTPDRIAGAISRAKNLLLTPEQFAQQARDFFQQTVARVYPLYERRLRAANACDFDDLLLLPALALTHDEELRRELDARYQHVLIDEYQDTNLAQYQIAQRLNMNYPNLCVVGDPDQSIYKWRGSDIRNILDFERDFPNARVVALERNFRSTPEILRAASKLIDRNTHRKKKTLLAYHPQGEPVQVMTFNTGLDEADGVAERIKAAVTAGRCQYRDCAVLVRINALTRTLESAFVKHGVPFQIVRGLAFYERKENKDILAYLRLIVNPNDTVSFLRAVNEPSRGVGKASLERLQAFAAEAECSLLAAAGQVARIPEIRGKAATGLRDFHKLLNELRAASDLPPHEVIRLVQERSGYKAMLKASGLEEDQERLANIEELITAAKQFHDEDPARTLADFLEQVALASDVDGWDGESNQVSVMTLHAAKGLEFPEVYLIAVEQGLLPHERSLSHDEDLEEERRLCFVGMTRAMRRLHLSHALCREYRGQLLHAIPSMFLSELPDDVERVDEAAATNLARSSFNQWRTRAGYQLPGSFIPEPVRTSKPYVPSARTDASPVKLDAHPARPDGPPAKLDGASAKMDASPPKLDAPPAKIDGPPVRPDGPPTDSADFEEGQVVQHEHYGIGKITHISGYGAMRKLKIRFPAEGEKTFVASKVKLRVVKRT